MRGPARTPGLLSSWLAAASVHRVSHSVNICMLGPAWRATNSRSPLRPAHRRAGSRPAAAAMRAASGSWTRPPSWSGAARTPELSVDEVMREAGLGRTIFYRHFDDIADLLLRASREAIEELYEAQRRLAREDPDAVERAFEAAVDGLPASRAAAARGGRGRGRRRADRARLRRDARPLRRPRRRSTCAGWPVSAPPPSPTSRETRAGAEPDERDLPAGCVRPRAAGVPRHRGEDPDRDLGRGDPPLTKGPDDGRLPHSRRAVPRPPRLPVRAALRGGGRAAAPPPRRGQRVHRALLPRGAELELPLPAHARPLRGGRAPGGVPRPRRVSGARTSPPIRTGTRTTATWTWSTPPPRSGGPRGRDRRGPGLGRPDRPSLGRGERRPGGAARGAQHRALHRPREQGLHGLARLRRAHAGPADRTIIQGATTTDLPRRWWPPTRRRSPTRRARRARSASRCSCRSPPRTRRWRGWRPPARRSAAGTSRRSWRSRTPTRCSPSRGPGERFTELIPTAGEQVRIEGAAHFLQEDRGRQIADAMLEAFGGAAV